MPLSFTGPSAGKTGAESSGPRLFAVAKDQPEEGASRVAVEAEIDSLLKAIEQLPAHWVVVSNEVGQGLVPPYPAGRVFRDLLGWANQRLAEKADEVIWMVAGIPVPIGGYRQGG